MSRTQEHLKGLAVARERLVDCCNRFSNFHDHLFGSIPDMSSAPVNPEPPPVGLFDEYQLHLNSILYSIERLTDVLVRLESQTSDAKESANALTR